VKSRIRRLFSLSAVGAAGLATLRWLAWRTVRRFEYLTQESAGAPGSFIDVDGVRLHYIEAGQGRPILLLHGWNGSTFNFRYTIAALSERFRVVALDLKGYGFSARPDHGDYSGAAQADLVAHLMDALGIGRATVAGHSMGGGVAQRLAVRHPERVERLILVDSVTPRELRRARFPRAFVPLLPVFAMFGLRRGLIDRVLRFNVHDPSYLTPDVKEGLTRPLHMKGHLKAQQLQILARRNETPVDAGAIRQAALILWGEHDRVIPLKRGRELARLIPNARLVVVPSAGHLPLEEQGAFCNREILAFLDGAAQATGEWSLSAEPAEAAP
jgi:pimeloyl-ACP methyl ester carboxylesterase